MTIDVGLKRDHMFYVFGLGGPIYRGELENLAQVAPVRTVARARALQSTDLFDPTSPPGSSYPRTPSPNARPSPHEALQAYAQAEQAAHPTRAPLERVRDVMSTDTFTIYASSPQSQAWEALAARGVAQAPVVDASNQLVGLLMRTNLLPAHWPTPHAATQPERTVGELMVTPVPAATPDTHLRRVARLLLDLRLPGLPVTDEHGDVLGFISRGDILRAVVADPPLDLWS